MTGLYETYGTNKALETEKGVILEYPGGVEITIRRAGGSNKLFSKVLSQKLRPHRRAHEQGTLDDAIADKILAEAYAEGVVIGWKNVKDREGQALDFTIENCVELFLALPDFFKDVQEQATSLNTFKNENEAIEEKN